MVGVPVFSDWRKFSAMLIHVHARPGHVSTHCVTFRVSSRTMYLGRSLSRSSSSSCLTTRLFSRRAPPRRVTATPQPTKTTRYLLPLHQLETKTPRLVKTFPSSFFSLFLLCKISRISIRATDVHRINRYYLGWMVRAALMCVSRFEEIRWKLENIVQPRSPK